MGSTPLGDASRHLFTADTPSFWSTPEPIPTIPGWMQLSAPDKVHGRKRATARRSTSCSWRPGEAGGRPPEGLTRLSSRPWSCSAQWLRGYRACRRQRAIAPQLAPASTGPFAHPSDVRWEHSGHVRETTRQTTGPRAARDRPSRAGRRCADGPALPAPGDRGGALVAAPQQPRGYRRDARPGGAAQPVLRLPRRPGLAAEALRGRHRGRLDLPRHRHRRRAAGALPQYFRWRRDRRRRQLIRTIEEQRGSRLITLIHRQEAISLLGCRSAATSTSTTPSSCCAPSG